MKKRMATCTWLLISLVVIPLCISLKNREYRQAGKIKDICMEGMTDLAWENKKNENSGNETAGGTDSYGSTSETEGSDAEPDTEADEEAAIATVCQAVKSLDFEPRMPQLRLTEEEEELYKEAYLKILKNEMYTSHSGEKQYHRDLFPIGGEFEDSLYWNRTFYYDDLDGDGKPELGERGNYMYIFKWEPGWNEFRITFCVSRMYVKKVLGEGMIWYHDGLHADKIRNRLYVPDETGEWDTALDLEEGLGSCHYYCIDINGSGWGDVGKENWDEVTAPFFSAMETEGIQEKTMDEIFGELLYPERKRPAEGCGEEAAAYPVTEQEALSLVFCALYPEEDYEAAGRICYRDEKKSRAYHTAGTPVYEFEPAGEENVRYQLVHKGITCNGQYYILGLSKADAMYQEGDTWMYKEGDKWMRKEFISHFAVDRVTGIVIEERRLRDWGDERWDYNEGFKEIWENYIKSADR